jgi:hypothetical protein
MNITEVRLSLLHGCIMEQNPKSFSTRICNVALINWVHGDAQYQHPLLQGMKVG